MAKAKRARKSPETPTRPTSPESDRGRRMSAPALGAVLLPLLGLAAAARLLGAGARGLWLDEAASWHFIRGSLGDLPEALRWDSGPPLYYALLHAWSRLFGVSEVALRAFSALAGVALVGLLFLVAHRLFGQRVALLAALVLAVLPVQLRYSQEARGYTLLALLGLAAMASLLLWVEGGKRRWWLIHALLFAALLYTHNYAFFLLAAGGIYAALEGWRRAAGGGWRRRGAELALAQAGLALAILLYLPWSPIFLTQLGNEGPYAWMRLAWEEAGFAGSLWATLRALSPGGGGPAYLGLPAAAWGGVASLLVAGVLVLGLLRLLRWRRFGPGPRQPGPLSPGGLAPRGTTTWLLAYFFVPLFGAALYSLVRAPIYLAGRIDQVVVPAFVLILVLGFSELGARLSPWVRLRPAAVASAAAALFALASLLAWRPVLAAGGAAQADEAGLAARLVEELDAGDAVLATGLTWGPLAYHLRERPAETALHAFPAEVLRHPGNLDREALLADPERVGELREEAADLLRELRPPPGVRRTIFIALVPDRVSSLLLDALRRDPAVRTFEKLGTYEQRLLGQPIELLKLELRWP